MKIAIGSDHGGVNLKAAIIDYLKNNNYEVDDKGCNNDERVDFVQYAKEVAEQVAAKQADLGILCCGTGIGMSIAANKIKGIRAAVVSDCFSAQATREHNDSNILCLGERVIGEGLALKIVDIWLNSQFQGGRHQQRVSQILALEQE